MYVDAHESLISYNPETHMYVDSMYSELQRAQEMGVKHVFFMVVLTENLLSTGVITHEVLQDALHTRD